MHRRYKQNVKSTYQEVKMAQLDLSRKSNRANFKKFLKQIEFKLFYRIKKLFSI